MMHENVNLIAVIIATIVSMAIGAGWYSLLARQWVKAAGFSPEEKASVEKGGSPVIYVIAAACHFLMAYILSGAIYHAVGGFSVFSGILSAWMIWGGFVLTSMIVNHRFQMKSWALTIIDSGHYLLVLLAQGVILGWFGT